MQASVHLAEILVRCLQGYVLIGSVVAFLFVALLPRIEPTARGASLGARIAILPGAGLLWPYVLIRSVRRLRNKAPLQGE